ncbi:MAG TPA: Gfo/Idh/MocA family oxidoreductase [Micromonosporaceae bacterium]
MIRVGLVGAGPWAGMFHAPMLANAPGLMLSAVWAPRREAAEHLAQRYGAAAAATFDDLLERCDAVAFSVPPDVQATLAPLAARAGRHMLLEKPLARTVDDADAIAAAADAAGVATQLMLTYRFTNAGARVPPRAGRCARPVRPHDLDRRRRVGRLAVCDSVAPGRRRGAARPRPPVLDLAEAAGGPVTEVRAAERGGVVTITTMHAGGTVGQIALSGTTPGAHGPLKAEAVTETGRFILADAIPGPLDDVQRAIADEFARTVRGEFTQQIDAHHGVRIQRMLAAVDESLDTGRPASPRSS